MSNEPQIPFGYKAVTGQLQKGDGIWDGAKGRFVKARKEYPYSGNRVLLAIRKCVAMQTELPVGVAVEEME